MQRLVQKVGPFKILNISQTQNLKNMLFCMENYLAVFYNLCFLLCYLCSIKCLPNQSHETNKLKFEIKLQHHPYLSKLHNGNFSLDPVDRLVPGG